MTSTRFASSGSIPALRGARPVSVALVGAGVMGRRHARVIASRPDRFELAAIMDVDPAVAASVADAHGAPVTPREADALARCEAVIVATPIGAHAATVRRALVAGKHVLVEKPIAESARAAEELLAVAEAAGPAGSNRARLFVGHSERFNPVVRALARLVDGASVRAIELRRMGPRSTAARAVKDHGALVNLAVHDFDLAAYLTRSPLVGAKASGTVVDGIEERAHVLARSASGAAVHLLVDQRPGDGTRTRSIALATAAHVWSGDLLAPSLIRTCRVTGVRESVPLDTEEPLLGQALAFAAAVRGLPATEIATGYDGTRALAAAERCARQLRG